MMTDSRVHVRMYTLRPQQLQRCSFSDFIHALKQSPEGQPCHKDANANKCDISTHMLSLPSTLKLSIACSSAPNSSTVLGLVAAATGTSWSGDATAAA
jgi:hypothetical protein